MPFPERDRLSLEQDLAQVEELIRRKAYIQSMLSAPNQTLADELQTLKEQRTSIKNQLANLD